MYSTGVESKPIRSEHRGERMQTVHVLMPEEFLSWIQAQARKENRSMGYIVRECVRKARGM
jgi:hypothetical protein